MKTFKDFIVEELAQLELLTEMPWITLDKDLTIDLEFELRLDKTPTELELTKYLQSILAGEVYLTKVKEPWSILKLKAEPVNGMVTDFEIVPNNHPNLKIVYSGDIDEPLEGKFLLKAGTIEKPIEKTITPMHVSDKEKFLKILQNNNAFRLRLFQIKGIDLGVTSEDKQNQIINDYFKVLKATTKKE